MDWLNAFVFLLLIAGHTALWVMYVNRTHAFPFRCSTLHRLRRLHDVMILLGPVLLVVCVGLTGPKLLLGGSWAALSPFWWGIVGACSMGFVLLVIGSVGHFFRRPPQMLVSLSSNIIDIAEHFGKRPVEEGKYHRLALLGINEQFDVEFNEKTFLLDALPKEFHELTILHISDWHFYGTVGKQFFERVSQLAAEKPVDLVCFSGDLIDNMKLVEWIPETLGQLKGKYGNYFILGNHDWYQRPDEVRDVLTRQGWIDVASRTVDLEIHGKTLQIGGDETPWMGSQPVFSQDVDFRLLLSHTPDNYKSAQGAYVDLMLSGHNHGGQVRLPILGPVYSPSRYGTLYASGTFWKRPTLLHISRGLSGRHPFRYRCRPEVTRILLQTNRSSP